MSRKPAAKLPVAEPSANPLNRIIEERSQGHATRKHLYSSIEAKLGKVVVSLYTSFVHPVMLDDRDCDTLDMVLRGLDLSRGIALLLSSPGGSAIAAERVIRALRAHSGKRHYECIVLGRAKSAATLVAFGASEIVMGDTSELGPVDPQVTLAEDGALKRFAVHTLVRGYEQLFEKATAAKGRIEPYLQQLQRYDARLIGEMRAQLELADSIAVKALESGMLKGQQPEAIKAKIQKFLTPEETKTHARPIYPEEAKGCGLSVRSTEHLKSAAAELYELHVRLDALVSSSSAAKVIEWNTGQLVMPPPRKD